MAMQDVTSFHPLSDDSGVRLELTTSFNTINVSESTEMRIGRLISENPVIIFSRSSCYMCHVMKHLLSTLGVHPTVIELEDGEMSVLSGGRNGAPEVFIGGSRVGGLESLMGLHLSESLVPMLGEAGAL
ncbi:hypothetical protein GIB67_041631 [Kingdonia uniflora]|uniref:Glutaredoxin domain-containing protein n=1 Tax=Kingdonia uniflora TaxID=39325 RepID=A0A7J7MQU0_9MAGN|nr:hypothetical protein GIB67_041631 [Kingdonia uniflora]